MMQGRIYRFERAQLEDAAAMLPGAPFGFDAIRRVAGEVVGKPEAAGALATALIKAGIITTRLSRRDRHWRYRKAERCQEPTAKASIDVKPTRGRKA